ncbi:MAG: hotdog fold thioesterase [Sphingobacteriaceae bacterium]|jgi:acyl-CoA thioesterase
MLTPKKIVDTMMAKDFFSQWLGIEVLEINEGHCKLKLTVRKDMLNGFGIAHGGITYCMADSALAFASNSYGNQCVSIETSISHTAKVKEGDVLTAEAKELNRGHKIAIYEVNILNQDEKNVGLFKGTVFNTEKKWM